ncbi:MAG: hydroxymethylbilane synthase [Anaerovoracaceae bacterium]|jgi:hydroxymethylbilane synthase
MNKRLIKIGSRESKLAVTQSKLVMDLIQKKYPSYQLELVTMKTTGDIILDRTLDKIGGKGLFVKELDQALRDGRIDLAVHSLKDMPMETPEDLPLLAFSKREDPRDVLVLPEGSSQMDKNKPIGCSSARRTLQLRALYEDVPVSSVRGNVLTRLAKLDRGEYGALVLAAAGLRRLGLQNRISRIFEPDEMIPSAGQGTLVIQGRLGENYDYLDAVHDEVAAMESMAERAFVRTLDGGCSSPIAAFAKVHEDEIKLRGLYYDEDTKQYVISEIQGPARDGEALGHKLALQLKAEVSNNGR